MVSTKPLPRDPLAHPACTQLQLLHLLPLCSCSCSTEAAAWISTALQSHAICGGTARAVAPPAPPEGTQASPALLGSQLLVTALVKLVLGKGLAGDGGPVQE